MSDNVSFDIQREIIKLLPVKHKTLMSDIVPFEIQIEIVKKLPVKSLLRFRQVSKSWKSVIDSSNFIANYHLSNEHRLLVRYVDSKVKVEKYVSIVDDDDDDDGFPQHKLPLIVPMYVRVLGKSPDIIGNSQGVLCFCVIPPKSRQLGYNPHSCETKTFVLWNPTIRKSVPIVVPNVFNTKEFETVVGFGVCPRTSDPTLVKINFISTWQFNLQKCIPSQVELFNLSSRSWKSLSRSVPRKSIELTWKQVCIDNFIYWLGVDRTVDDGKIKNLILSFDMITEEFTEIDLPIHNHFLFLSKLYTSLVVLETEYVGVTRRKGGLIVNVKEYCVWRMDHDGVRNSFTKLFVIKSPSDSLVIVNVHDFRITGEPIIEMLFTKLKMEDQNQNAVFVYKPVSQEITNTGVAGGSDLCLVKSYIQTLLLLDQ